MKKEKRKMQFKNIEVRSDNVDGKKTIEGLIPYDSKSVPMWGITEIIDRTAFNKTLKDKSEVRALLNHDDSKILGNTISDTLTLKNTSEGLICRCDLPNTTYANDLYEVIERGDVKTMSFGFTPIKWLEDDKGKLRTLKEVQLHEVSFGVTFPAYPETNTQILRGLEKNNIDIDKLNETLEKTELNDDDKLIINNTINTLSNIIGIKNDNKEIEKQELIEVKEDTTNLQLQIEAEILS